MAWNAANVPDLSGRVAVVTGANGGLGLQNAKDLARAGAHVVMAARDPQKAQNAVKELLAEVPGASYEVVSLDLSDQGQTKDAASDIVASHPKVDILINNAGLMAMPESSTHDGFEMQFGVNHLGHWTFTAGLMPALLAADAARVVTVTSIARHNAAQVDPDNPNLEGNYEEWRAYGTAKLANFHFAHGLQREFARAGVNAQSFAAHPGISHTDLQKRTVREGGGGTSGTFWENLAEKRGMPASRGSLPQLRAATDPRAKAFGFYGPRWGMRGRPVRLMRFNRRELNSAVANLWSVSEKMTRVPLYVAGDASA